MIRKNVPVFAVLVMFAAVGQRHDAWEIIGPGGGGTMLFPSVSRGNPHTILFASDMSGAYVSHDSGSSWRMYNLGGVVRSVVFDPNDARTYYALTSAGCQGSGRTLW